MFVTWVQLHRAAVLLLVERRIVALFLDGFDAGSGSQPNGFQSISERS
jgi:hypothetical protein